MNTKEKIAHEALKLFAIHGFDAVSVRTIARAVGIKESSLYNHFVNKQDIFDWILQEYEAGQGQMFQSLSLTENPGEFEVDNRTIDLYRNMAPEMFAAMAGQVFDYYFKDETSVLVRRMLTHEQFRGGKAAGLFREWFIQSPIAYQAGLFAALMEAGTFEKGDPEMMARAFFSPIFQLFFEFDSDDDGVAAARAIFDRHIAAFGRNYSK